MRFILVGLQIILLFACFWKVYCNEKNRNVNRRQTDYLKARHYGEEDREEKRQERLSRLIQEGKAYTEKRRKLRTLFIIVILMAGITVSFSLMTESGEEDIQQECLFESMKTALLLAAGGVEGSCDPIRYIDRKGKMTEWEIATQFAKENLFFDWYGEAPKGLSEKRKYYADKCGSVLGQLDSNIVHEEVGEKEISREEKAAYGENIKLLDKIEESKVPEGYTRNDVEMGRVKPLTVSVDTYLWEYKLRWQCYKVKPAVPMLQQMARAAEDSVILLAEDSYRLMEMIEMAGSALADYFCLMRFGESGESRADCCYWVAKLFCVIADHLPAEWTELIDHCELMSYTFCEKGVIYLNIAGEENDHEDNLRELYHTMDMRTAAH